MHQHRAGEDTSIPFRNERYFCVNGVWFFEVRGGAQRGPYTTKKEMEGELLMFIREQNMLSQTFTRSA